MHHLQAGGYYPKDQATHRTSESWLPALPTRFDTLVNHLSWQLLARAASPDLLSAACIRLKATASTPIASPTDFPAYKMTRLLGTLLDSPQHMTR
jgi:hypothetical protein